MDLLEDTLDEVAHSPFRLRRESSSCFEIPALESADDQVLWKATKDACHLDGLDKAESMARPAEHSSGQRLKTRIPAVECPGLRARLDGIKEDDGVGPFPGIHQVRTLAVVFQDPERARALLLQSLSGDHARPVITAVGITYSDHQNLCGHCASLCTEERVAQTFASQKVCGLSEPRTAEFEKRELCATLLVRMTVSACCHSDPPDAGSSGAKNLLLVAGAVHSSWTACGVGSSPLRWSLKPSFWHTRAISTFSGRM